MAYREESSIIIDERGCSGDRWHTPAVSREYQNVWGTGGGKRKVKDEKEGGGGGGLRGRETVKKRASGKFILSGYIYSRCILLT